MKKFSILTISTISILMFGITACGEKVSNNLGGATRGNNAYDYNYDYSATDTTGNNMLNHFGFDNTNAGGAGYWDYYGITNGSANDSMRSDLTNNYSTRTNLANNYNSQTDLAHNYNNSNTMMGTTNTANAMLDSATVAD